MEVKCQTCNKTFEVKPSMTKNRKYCTRECYRNRPLKRISIKCTACGKAYKVPPSRNKQKYCSVECRIKHHQHTFKCKQCSKEKTIGMAQKTHGGGKFCSKSCASKHYAKSVHKALQEKRKNPEYEKKYREAMKRAGQKISHTIKQKRKNPIYRIKYMRQRRKALKKARKKNPKHQTHIN